MEDSTREPRGGTPRPGHRRTIDSPVGPLYLEATAGGLTRLQFEAEGAAADDRDGADPAARAHVEAAERALAEYFSGSRKDFGDLELAPSGTPFQLRVWRALRAIPYGATSSYGEIAARVGEPGGARAVGLANNRNPIAIVVPCHRVIGADGSLVGYGGGLERKEWLLSHEGALARPLFPAAR